MTIELSFNQMDRCSKGMGGDGFGLGLPNSINAPKSSPSLKERLGFLEDQNLHETRVEELRLFNGCWLGLTRETSKIHTSQETLPKSIKRKQPTKLKQKN